MGSSARKKREKKKDFQKEKLKVGKGRPKAQNHTDTSFRSRALVLNKQLDVDAPSQSATLLHQVSLLTSRSDSQRRDALGYLTSHLASTPSAATLPMTTVSLVESLSPLILDASSGVRNQLLKLLNTMPKDVLRDNVAKVLPYMRAGMTHLSLSIRLSAVDFLSHLIDTAGQELVSCPGGWIQTLECFVTVLGWRSASAKGWSQGRSSFGGEAKSTARIMHVLADFLHLGLALDDRSLTTPGSYMKDFPRWRSSSLSVPTRSNPYAYLNLFGAPSADDAQILDDRDVRAQAFVDGGFKATILAGVDNSKKEGGEMGRAAGLLMKTLDHVEMD